MKVIKAPNNYLHLIGSYSKSIFLAGSIEQGTAENWQDRFSRAMSKQDVLLLNPRRDDWDSSWHQRKSNSQFNQQVTWELDAMNTADIIAMFFHPDTKSPITLLELGLHIHDNLFVCCPEKFWRFGNIEIVCDRYGVQLFTQEQEWIRAIQKELIL